MSKLVYEKKDQSKEIGEKQFFAPEGVKLAPKCMYSFIPIARKISGTYMPSQFICSSMLFKVDTMYRIDTKIKSSNEQNMC